MEQYSGKAILNGIAIGRIVFYVKNRQQVKRYRIQNVESEIARYEKAKESAVNQLSMLYEKACAEVGEANATIFEVHKMMLEDDYYNESVHDMIRKNCVNAEFSVATTGNNFAAMFSEMDDEYFKARAVDVKDISNRLVGILAGKDQFNENVIGDEPVIVVAEDLTPSETVQMNKTKLMAVVTKCGSVNSHTAILAKTMNIPALFGVKIQEDWHGKMAIVDGKQGKIIIDPNYFVLEEYIEAKKKEEETKAMLLKLKGQPDITRDGREIKLYANIGNTQDVESALENDAAGIGLFRSEFLYLEKDYYPTEEEQFKIYKTVAQNMAGKKVVIRTLDIGADKQVSYFNIDKEENPSLGYRAIRICLDRRDIFKTQLRAIYRASAFGKISIMFPMIISVNEVLEIKKICKEVKMELREQSIHYGRVEVGVMIETPAAVMISDLLAKEVDFLSIGTNDLTQYTLAIDRKNAKLDSIYDTYHPAIFRMIQMVIDNGHKEGCWVGICGELGADTRLTEQFIQMGMDELSVSPNMILPVRNAIRNASYKTEEEIE